MLELRPLSATVPTLAAVLLSIACGGGDGGSGSGTESETTVDDWRDYCIATFTEEYPVLDGFGEVAFTAHVGDEFVLSSFDADSNPEIVYLADTGPSTLELEEEVLPFTSNCAVGETTDHIAVFSDTTVYGEQELTTSLCELSAGYAVPRDGAAVAGYSITQSTAGEGRVYEIMLNSLSADCGGASHGYVDVPQTTLWGSYTHLVPIIVIAGPAP